VSRPRQWGFALVLVLWTLALLGIIAGSFAFEMRSESRLASHFVARVQAEALAEAGVRLAIVRLLQARAGSRWRADGTPYTAAVEGREVTIRIRSVQGKADLNRAADGLLRAVVGAATADESERDRITDAILDWRDGNHNRRLHGAEDPDYVAAGYPYGSRDGPFLSVAELKQVMGMNARVYARLAPMVTIFSGRPRIEPASAPESVLRALPGVDAAALEAFLAARDAAAERGSAPLTAALGSAGGFVSAPVSSVAPRAGTFEVIAEAVLDDARAYRAAVIRARPVRSSLRRTAAAAAMARSALGGSVRRRVSKPYSVLAWHETPPARPLADREGGPEPGGGGTAR